MNNVIVIIIYHIYLLFSNMLVYILNYLNIMIIG